MLFMVWTVGYASRWIMIETIEMIQNDFESCIIAEVWKKLQQLQLKILTGSGRCFAFKRVLIDYVQLSKCDYLKANYTAIILNLR